MNQVSRLLVAVGLAPLVCAGSVQAADRGVDLSFNYSALSYQTVLFGPGIKKRSTNPLGGGLGVVVPLGDRLAVFAEGSVHKTEKWYKSYPTGLVYRTDSTLLYGLAGIEGRVWDSAKRRRAYLRVGGGVTSFTDDDPTYAVMAGAGVSWKVSERVAVRVIEIDLINARHEAEEKNSRGNHFRVSAGVNMRVSGQ